MGGTTLLVGKVSGSILDPTKDQFPWKGIGRYIEFDGMIECLNCARRYPRMTLISTETTHFVAFSAMVGLYGVL